MSKHKRTILIISHDVVGDYMAGPGIRYYHIARVLSSENNVILAAPTPIQFQQTPIFNLLPYDTPAYDDLLNVIEQADIIIVPAIWIAKIPRLQTIKTPIVVDAYDPFVVETLARGVTDVSVLQQELAKAYLCGDFFICASEQQRDWLLGLLEAFGRINALNFTMDNTLRQLVDIVPYGFPEKPHKHTKQVIKGVWHNISKDDYVIVWGGGLWKWLDPLTAIKAVSEVWKIRQDIRLIFPGTKHPNKNIPVSLTYNIEAKKLAEELNLLNQAVFFGEWIPYEDWANVLFESDIALSLHYDTIETHFSYRSRILEYIMANLPIITTRGSATSGFVQDYGLGYVVDYQDVDDVADALLSLLPKLPNWHEQVAYQTIKQKLSWDNVLQPLRQFCKNPHLASDKHQIQLGSPFYVSQITQLKYTIQQYENGKFIRFMRWMKKFQR